MKRKMLTISATLFLLKGNPASAAVTLLDNSDWKVTLNGFIDNDISKDSTRGLAEVIGNSPVARAGTFAGDNGKMQFSGRNSRFGFAVYAPEQNDWKTKGVFEFDFLGYDPTPSTSGTKNTEAGFYQNPAIRIRHAYFGLEKEGWQILSGQTWSLFGWQPYYFPTTLTVAPAPGELFQRDLQFMAMKTVNFGESSRIQTAISAEKPSQRDSSMPNLNLGVRYALDSYRAAYASTYGDIKQETLSVGISGSFRQFETPLSVTNTASQSHKNSSAVAIDGLIPLIPVSNSSDLGNSLTLSFEFTSGTGYADTLPNWSGGLGGFPQGANSIAANTNLDAGFGGFNSSGNFDLVKLQTFNLSLQYVLSSDWKSFVTAGYTSIHSDNVNDFVASAASASDIYDRSSMYFVNYIHDFTKQIRVGAEYSKVQTHYISDDQSPYNDRWQITALYRF
ncbi:MAG: hypothetical protein ACXWRE_07105 [Pseudobdellovibrionaceae bacterium]